MDWHRQHFCSSISLSAFCVERGGVISLLFAVYGPISSGGFFAKAVALCCVHLRVSFSIGLIS